MQDVLCTVMNSTMELKRWFPPNRTKISFILQTFVHFIRHAADNVTDVIYASEGTVRSSLCITEHHTIVIWENAGRAPHIPNWAVWPWWFSSHSLYLFAKRLADAQNQSGASDIQSTTGQLTNYSNSERESNFRGQVHNRSIHWMSYPLVSVVYLILLMRRECIFVYYMAFSQFYLLLFCKL